MNMYMHRMCYFACSTIAAAIFVASAHADPLPNEVLKFHQEPMVNTAIQGQIYFGHDELSTAYADVTQPTPTYVGTFMADDFADKFNTPVVHLTWWGSYINDNNAAFPPQPHAQKFLIAFESDVPASTATGPSHPGCTPVPCNPVLQSDVVTLGALAPGSGTFTETLVRGPDPVLGEALYKYNAELHLGHAFQEQADHVYWLKVTALQDLPAGIPVPPPAGTPGIMQWGWHNRDYTVFDALASGPPNVVPGEFQDGVVPGTTQPIWHFQDDAVTGNLQFTPSLPPGQDIRQANMVPANYQFINSAGVGPIDGPPGIEQHSKDLAFRLYTSVPEPASCLLIACGSFGVALIRRRRLA